jgi:hypothetical protein
MKLSVVTALLAALPIISALTVETRAANIPRPYLRALKDCNSKYSNTKLDAKPPLIK